MEPVTGDGVDTRRVLTVPNALSVLRLLGVPLFLWLILVPRADGLAVLLLCVSGFTDWLDGQLARRLHQVSRLGQLLDPAADRLYIVATLVGLTLRDVIPLWLLVILVSRDVLLSAVLLVLRGHGFGPWQVHYLGKAATFNLLYAFPLLLLGDAAGAWPLLARVFGWAFAIWGTFLYWYAGGLYLLQAVRLIRSQAAGGIPPRAGQDEGGPSA